MKYFYPANALPLPLYPWFSRCCFKSRLLLVFVFSIAVHKGMIAQTTLAPGDIVFTGYNAVPAAGSAPDTFSFVALTPMSSGTTIYFTERGFQNPGWQGSGGTEGTITCVTSAVLAIGDEVQVAGVGSSAFTRNGVPVGSVSVTGGNAITGLSLSNAGDQIIAFQGGGGDPAAGGVSFIAGISWHLNCGTTTDAGWNGSGCTYGAQSSAMPSGLVGGTSAFLAGTAGTSPNNDQAKFNCNGAPYSTVASLRAAIMNKANWVFGGATGTTQMNIPSGCLYFSTCTAPSVTVNPPNRTVCAGGSTTMGVTATGTGLSYQWYVNTGSGFNPISNGAPYSNATTATLTISGATAAMNGYQYQVRVTGTCGNKTSSNATLTVDVVAGTTSITPVSCNGGSNGTATVTLTSGITPVWYSWSPSGGTGVTATGLAANTYTVTITDDLGCTGQATAVVTQPAQSVSASVTTVNNITCPGATNGNMTVTPSGGTPGYTYLWNTGATTATVFGLSAGTYVCTVRDSKNCPTTTSATVTSPAAFVTSSSSTAVSCNGGANGTATVNVSSGGVGPYTYQWSAATGSQTTQTATGLAAGSYSCTIRDANLCPTVISGIIVTQPAAFVATASQTNVSCYGGSNGVAAVFPSGGNGGYTYLWTNGYTGQVATGLAAGDISCTITDSKGCTVTKNFTIAQPAAVLTGSITAQTNVSCNGGSNGSATVKATGGTAGYAYSWSPSGGTNATATGLAAGTYTVSIEDANGCTATTMVTITEPTAFTASISSQTNIACNGASTGAATVMASGGTPGYTYSWSPSGGTAATASGLAAGTYTVTVTDANSCQTTASATITQPTAFKANISSQTNIACNGGSTGSATVMASGGTGAYTYSWSPSGGTAATASGLVAGAYTVTVTDANSCKATATATIVQPTALKANISSQTNIACNGGSTGSATVLASGGTPGYTYSWSPSGGTAATATGLAAGTYTVTIEDANGCQKTTSVAITEPAALSSSTSKTDVSCNGGSNGSATVTVSGGTGTKTYSWSPSGGTAATATGLAAGSYTCTITDANSCSITKTFTITQPSAISTTASQVNVSCNGGTNGSATVTATGGAGPYTYSWSPGGGTAATATGLVAGTYTVTVTDANSCTATRNFTITQPVAMTATTSQTNVACNGGSNGSATVTVSGGTGTKTYSWSPSGGTAATATGLAAGSYTCTITDANSCSITKTFTITQPSAISTTASQVNISCNGGSNGSATVTATGGAGPYTYSWSPSGGTAATATGLAASTYTVTVTDANSCTATKSFTITQPAALSVSATKTSVSCNGGSNGTATATVTGGTGSYNYSWSPSGGTGATATGLIAGTYTVTVTDANECSATQSVTITEPAKVTVSATPGSQTICSGEQTNIALSSVPSGASFSWSVSTVSGNVSGAAASSGTSIQQTLTGSGVIKYVITPANNTCAGQEKEVVITVNALTSIEMHPADKSIYDEETAGFAIEANNASAYKWQVDAGNGFVDLSDDEHYSGTSSYILKISNAIGSMNGNLYRCVATGNCAPVPSNSAKLTVKVRTVQAISFAAADTKVYGDDNYTPAANTNSNLELNFSSSDASVAEIVSGKIHIKKAGQATITASQPGNDDYKPAASVQQVLTIVKKPITVSLAESPAISKVYDTYSGIKLSADNYILKGVETGDDVIVKGTASFEDSNAGDDKTIQVVEFVLNGEQAQNYELTTSSATVKGAIKRKEITLSLQSSPLISKTYNASAIATLATSNYILDGILGEDDVTVASGKAVYSDKKVGADKEITVTDFVLGGAQKDNYTVTTQSAVTSGTIKAKEITLLLADAPAISKVYDGTALATVPESKYQLQGIETGDDVTVKGAAVYNSKNAGDDKTVTVNEFVLNGEDADNYRLSTTELTAEGAVEKAILTVRVISDATPITKEYDGTTKANISANNYVVEGIVGEDKVVLNKPEAGVYEDKHGGSEKKVTVSGLQLSGADADNYQLESATISGNVGKITRKVIGITADSKTKVYGQADPALTYVAEGKLEGDELPGTLERTAGKNVGHYKVEQGSLTGGDDYLIEWFQHASFTITPAPLTITAEDKAKKQGSANPAFTFSYNGLVEGDRPTDLEAQPVAATNATTGSPIGYYDIEASGAASANYTITYTKGKLTVTPSGGDNFNVKVWSSSPDVLQVRIFSTVAQKSAIILYTETGQQVILQQHQLSVGVNSISVPVGHLASSTYVLSVAAEKFKDAQKVKVK